MEFQSDRHNLIAVLDWGIGHASRSLALARQLEANGETVGFASAGRALEMLAKERPDLELHELPAYGISYRSKNMLWNVSRQLPRILRTVRREKEAIDQLLTQFPYDRLISDSRFGCYSDRIPSVLLTHQLHPLFGVPLVGWIYRRYLNRVFLECWVPDHPGPDNLSGLLSRADGYPNVQYIGPLSRLKRTDSAKENRDFKVVALLSGPEPQRTYLEKALSAILPTIPGRHLLIAGQPESAADRPVKATGTVGRVAFTEANATASYLQHAEMVVCRSGYSSLMDLERLGTEKIILVPTPGQTEQQYLAERMAARGKARWLPQAEISHLAQFVQSLAKPEEN